MTLNRLRRTRGALAAAVVVIGFASSAGCGSSSSQAGASHRSARGGATVVIRSLEFTPGILRVKVGTKVIWRDEEPITHTVTSGRVFDVDRTTGLRSGQKADGRFNARLTGAGKTFAYTFTQPGTYSYFCAIHFGMNATVVVTK